MRAHKAQPSPLYVISKAWAYGTAIYAHDCARRRLKNGLRWGILAALRPRLCSEWFSWVEKPDLRPFLAINPVLALKPLRPYLTIRWNSERRSKVIRDTYDLVLQRGGALRLALLHPQGITLARSNIAPLGLVDIRMGRDFGSRKEGEFALSVQCQELDGWRTTLTFAFEQTAHEQLTFYIGCIQGRGGIEAVRQVTKAMHGLRPKALMVFVAQEVARILGARRILGAGDAIHVYRKRHLVRPLIRHGILFDYDAFWLELGAEVDAEGWFHLPVEAIRRDRDDVKPNKRSMYAKRYALLDELAEQIRLALSPNSDFAARRTEHNLEMACACLP
jgi:uncharacterized protein